MAAEVERDGLDAGAAPPLHQELDCNGSGGTPLAPKPAAQGLAYQGGTSRPARNAQPGQLEAGEEPASEDLRGASSEEEDEAEEEGAGIPIDCYGNRAFFFKGNFIASSGHRCEGFVRVDEGSPRMSLAAWTTKCTGNRRLSTREVMVVDADGQTKRTLRDVLDGRSGEEEDPISQYRGVVWKKAKGRWEVEMRATKVSKKKIFLGYFDFEDEEDAARMYDRSQIAYLGRKAYVVAYEAGRRNLAGKKKVAYPNFPVEQYSHELDWLEGLGVIKFKARLKAARKKLKKAKKPATPQAVLQEAGLPSVPGPQQQHGASPMEVKDEEIEIRKLAREGTPPPPVRPAAGQASRPKRSRPAARGDSKAAKRQKPAQVPAKVQPQAAIAAELRQALALEAQRRDLREAELKEQNEVLLAKVDGLATKSAQQQRLIKHLEQYNAHLERFKAHVLEENEELRRLLLAKEG